MTLASETQTRYPSTLLSQVTNHDAPTSGGTAINTARLNAAAADAAAEFETFTGLAFDDTDAQHIAVGCLGVMAYLYEFTGRQKQNAQEYRDRFERGMLKIANALGNGRRILPTSLSTRQRTTEPAGLTTDDDRTRYSDFVPERPRGYEVEDLERRLLP